MAFDDGWVDLPTGGDSDGSILLSVQIDSTEAIDQINKLEKELKTVFKNFDKFTQNAAKLNTQLARAEKLLAKQALDAEKLEKAQQQTRTATEQANAAADRAAIQAEKRKQAEEKTALAAAKTAREQEKVKTAEQQTALAAARTATETQRTATEIQRTRVARERVYQATLQSEQAERRLAEAQARGADEANRQLSPMESLTNFIEIQHTRLGELTDQYSSYVLMGQESSAEAQQLAGDIQSLSSSLSENESALANAVGASEDLVATANDLAPALEMAAKYAKNVSNDFNKLKSSCEKVTTTVKKLASTLGVYFSIRAIVNFSKESAESASETEAYLIRLGKLYGESGQDIYDWANANAEAFGMSKTSAYEAIASYGNLLDVITDTNDRATVSAKLVQATAVIASQTGRTFDETYEKIQSGLYGNTRAIDDLGISVRQASLEQTDAYKNITKGVKSWNDLTDAELMSARAMAIIEQTTKRYGEEVLDTTALVKSRFKSAWEDFKATWGKLVNKFLVPALEVLTKILKVITEIINKFVGQDDTIGDTSSSVDKITESEEALGDQIEDTTKKLEKQLAGFDDLMILTSGASSDTGTDLGDIDLGLDDDNFLDSGSYDSSQYDEIIDGILDGLARISQAVGAGLFAAGLIMLFSGQVFSGLGLMAEGATLYAAGKSYNNNDEAKKTKEKLMKLVDYIPEALIALGLIMLFMGQIGWGVGLMIAGIIADDLTDEETWELFNTATITEKIDIIEAKIGKAAASIGVILLLMGQYAWGIGLIVFGIYLWKDVKEEHINNDAGDDIVNQCIDWFDGWEETLKTLGYVMAILGIILLFVPGAQGFGLSMLGKGAGVLFGVSAADILTSEGDSLMEQIKNWCKTNWEELQTISWVMIAIGIICLFTGHIGAGIALLGGGLAMQYGMGKLTVDEDGSIAAYFEKLGAYFVHKIADLGDTMRNAVASITDGWPDWLVTAMDWGTTLLFPNLSTLYTASTNMSDLLEGKTLEEDLAAIDEKYAAINRANEAAKNASWNYVTANKENLAVGQFVSQNLDWSTAVSQKQAAMTQATVVLEVDGRQFGSAVVELGGNESTRIGTSLVSKSVNKVY